MTRHCLFLLASCLALNACGDASADVAPDETLCGEARDPDGLYCGPGNERIDSTRALTLLREAYPGAQIYLMESYWLNVDGDGTRWDFWLTDQDGTWLIAKVYARGEVVGEEMVDAGCDGTPFEPLDSRRAVHQAVAKFEAQAGLFRHGLLFLSQSVCGQQAHPEHHYVVLFPRADDAGAGDDYYARFRYDRSFIDLVGPCPGMGLYYCLAGVVDEPEE